MGRDITTVCFCHLSSQRIPLKPLQRLSNGKRLVEIAFEQLVRLKDIINPNVVCWPGDLELKVIALSLGLPIIPMSFEQSRSSNWEIISSSIQHIQTDWIFELNNICHPFLRDETILEAYEYCKICTHPFITAKKTRNIYWNDDHSPLLLSTGPVNTSTAPAILSATHMCYGLQPSDCGIGNSKRITNFEPLVLDYQSIELIDIDWPNDLELAQRIKL